MRFGCNRARNTFHQYNALGLNPEIAGEAYESAGHSKKLASLPATGFHRHGVTAERGEMLQAAAKHRAYTS